MSARLRAWAPAVLWAAVLFAFSSRPTLPVDLSSGRDKIAHCLAYAVLGALIARALGRRSLIPLAIGIGVLYALFDEVYQSFVPGRDADVADWVADALGTIAGAAGYHLWHRWKQPSARRTSRDPDPLAR